MPDIREWLDDLGLGEYAEAFDAEKIDVDALPHVTEADLKEMGLPIGPRRKVLAAVAVPPISNSAADGQAHPAVAEHEPMVTAERRQITVMFCDLVGSTALSERLDPEDLRDLMAAYRTAAGAVVENFKGHVAQYLGDGLMVYFGWPQAHEDDAERAIRAGLEIVAAVKAVPAPEPLSVRIGIATGPVVIGAGADDAAANRLAVGETPNLAARLQAIAGTDQIVIGPATHRIAGGAFAYADLGACTLKGILEPVQAWQVAGVSSAEGRFEAQAIGGLTPFVGRDTELQLLRDRWQRAREEEGQVVLLSGEPGIGKSRLARELREHAGAVPHHRLRYQCSPYYTNTAFYPIVDQLERAAGFAVADDADSRLDKLETLIGGDDVALLAAMMSLPIERYPPLGLSAIEQKSRTIEALVGQTLRLAADRPVLLMFEDAHWSDPTTLETLGAVIAKINAARVLILVTHRPEFTAPWSGHPHVTAHSLNRLGRSHAADIVARLTGGKPLPGPVLDQIIAKTDGVPLFVEELAKTVLESGLLIDTGTAYEIDGPLPPLAIPTTIQDSLMARLDRLAPVRDIAQIGACIGRDFPHDLLAAVAPISGEALEDALRQLVISELVFSHGTGPTASYSFKHALVQDAAYDSILKSRRLLLHREIATWLEQHRVGTQAAAPERLAEHYTAAEMPEKAVPYWFEAGEIANARASADEAINNYQNGITAAGTLDDPAERDRWELECLFGIGMVHEERIGWGAPGYLSSHLRAKVIGERLGDLPTIAFAMRRLSIAYIYQGEVRKGVDEVRALYEIVDGNDDPGLRFIANEGMANALMFTGEWRDARTYAMRAIEEHDRALARNELVDRRFPQIEAAYLTLGYTNWMLGYPDRAKRAMDQAIKLSESANIDRRVWLITQVGADLHAMMRMMDEARHYGEIVLDIQKRQPRFEFYSGLAGFHAANARVWIDSDPEGIHDMRRALDLYAKGSSMRVAGLYANLAEALGRLGRPAEGLAVFSESPDRQGATPTPARFAEIWRIEGELHAMVDPPDYQRAETCLREAIAIAQSELAKSWELRAATSLARIWRDQDRSGEAHALLQPVYDWFTEGFGTADLKDAKALLDELA